MVIITVMMMMIMMATMKTMYIYIWTIWFQHVTKVDVLLGVYHVCICKSQSTPQITTLSTCLAKTRDNKSSMFLMTYLNNFNTSGSCLIVITIVFSNCSNISFMFELYLNYLLPTKTASMEISSDAAERWNFGGFIQFLMQKKGPYSQSGAYCLKEISYQTATTYHLVGGRPNNPTYTFHLFQRKAMIGCDITANLIASSCGPYLLISMIPKPVNA